MDLNMGLFILVEVLMVVSLIQIFWISPSITNAGERNARSSLDDQANRQINLEHKVENGKITENEKKELIDTNKALILEAGRLDFKLKIMYRLSKAFFILVLSVGVLLAGLPGISSLTSISNLFLLTVISLFLQLALILLTLLQWRHIKDWKKRDTILSRNISKINLPFSEKNV